MLAIIDHSSKIFLNLVKFNGFQAFSIVIIICTGRNNLICKKNPH
jgi:hypothetical protein